MMLQLNPRAQELVREAMARHGSITAVAAKLGYSRTALSLAISGRYRANSLERLEAAIADAFEGQIACPHLKADISSTVCRDYREQPIPTHDPRALRHWQACRFCTHNPRPNPQNNTTRQRRQA